MYVSPNHPDPPRPASPPAEQGRRLATFARGRDDEMRVCLSEYQGRPFISLRVWSRGSDGQFWPDRAKGVSVRMHELAPLLAALGPLAAGEGVGPGEQTPPGRLDARGPRDDQGERPEFVERGRRRGPEFEAPPRAKAVPSRDAFDEFGGEWV